MTKQAASDVPWSDGERTRCIARELIAELAAGACAYACQPGKPMHPQTPGARSLFI